MARWAIEAPGPRNTTATTLERWAEDVLRCIASRRMNCQPLIEQEDSR